MFVGIVRALLASVVAVTLCISSACSLVPAERADGSECSDDKGCKSGRCRDGYCAGSSCGGKSSACDSGWKCVHSDADPITGFFGNDGSDTCQPTCGSCPGNRHCTEQDTPGETLCRHGAEPLPITIETVRGVVGENVKVVASADPSEYLATCRWQVDGEDSGETAGPELMRTFDEPRSYEVTTSCVTGSGRSGFGKGTVEIAPN